MARKKPLAKQDEAKVQDEGNAMAKRSQPLTDFHIFPKLPIELRLMIIEEALKEDEKGRPARIVLFDHNTRRISPLVEQSKAQSPMLFVNKLFRKIALTIYVMLDVIEVGVPYIGEFGDEDNFHNDEGELEYNLEIAKLIDREANGEGRYYDGPKGRVYVRPATDIFLTGLVPRQISNTETFSYLLDAGPNESWGAPMCHVTERLPRTACAKISIMRSLVWDPGCPSCGEYHPIHCRECFLEGRGEHLADPGYDASVYFFVKEFGIYVMGGDNIPETLMYLLAVTDHPTKDFLEEMTDNYLVLFRLGA